MDNFASRYVPELDGLRGVAILAVLVHHQLTPFLLQGGFLGVDLFFVLSGFLITGLLLAEFDQTETISLKNFYLRRLLRLGPALALYLLACVVVANHTKVITLARQLKLILFALIYATNWRMAFGWDESLDPTAIIWSLSIEEQFYLVWPLVFSACLFLRIKPRHIASGLAIVIFGVLIHRYRLLNSGADFSRMYYGTDTRADALLVGCFTALLPVRKLAATPKRWLSVLAIGLAGCLIYAMLVVGFTNRFLYQGGFTLIALLCASLVFISAYCPPRSLTLALGWAPLRWLGRISYGLYLWHWLIVRNTSFYTFGKFEAWARLALALAVAAASFYLVERPFNKLKHRFATPTRKPDRPSSASDTEPPIPSLAMPLAS